jgi:hypothetical protein
MKTFSPSQICRLFDTSNVFSGASGYCLATEQWLLGPYALYFDQMLKSLGVHGYKTQWNCKDFSSLYRMFAQRCHADTLRPERPERLAIGEIWYQTRTGGGHAINVAVLGVEPTRLLFVEPQSQLAVTLTEAEIASIAYVRL